MLELPDGTDAVHGCFFELRRSGVNGKPMAMDRIDETVVRGTAETWTLRNGADMTHNFHVHDMRFRVLEVNGREPEPALRGRKDTVAIPVGTTMKIALRFDGPADPDTPCMYHRRLPAHEGHGMTGRFVVVEPGGRAGRPKAHEGH
ncbi:multicopper oxidase domain-containing protein [Streptomyces sp. NBC_00184]|uniref:multicopper oxidase domain-containing protein n=1 Tax=Streptomyces sp. NBC_00184 TaxID=2975673 RepID=UPI002E29BD0F|nr:multicopper oxidase domain-containing protein [Streptomyces sp. NBC_00184]